MIPLYYQKLAQPFRGGDDEPRARQGRGPIPPSVASAASAAVHERLDLILRSAVVVYVSGGARHMKNWVERFAASFWVRACVLALLVLGWGIVVRPKKA